MTGTAGRLPGSRGAAANTSRHSALRRKILHCLPRTSRGHPSGEIPEGAIRFTNELILVLGQLGIIAALGLAGALVFFRRSFNLRWFLAALMLYLVYDFLLTHGFFLISDPLPGASWNWTGKIMAIAGTLAIAALPMFGYARSGITPKQKPGVITPLIVFAFVSALFAWLGNTGRRRQAGRLRNHRLPVDHAGPRRRNLLPRHLPARDEPGLPCRPERIRRHDNLGGLLTSVLFGLAHAMDYGKQGYAFDAMTFAITGVPSLLLLWLRERTGSILLPIIGHNISNGVSTLV